MCQYLVSDVHGTRLLFMERPVKNKKQKWPLGLESELLYG